MSRLNYILSWHRTQSRMFAYIINSWYACFPMITFAWQDFGDLLDPNYLQTLKAGGRERERERETSACIRISFNLEKYHVSVLKMILGDASRAHRLLQDKVGYWAVLMLCMLSTHAQMFKFPEFHSDLIWIRTLTTFFSLLRERGSKYHNQRAIIGPPAKRL